MVSRRAGGPSGCTTRRSRRPTPTSARKAPPTCSCGRSPGGGPALSRSAALRRAEWGAIRSDRGAKPKSRRTPPHRAVVQGRALDRGTPRRQPNAAVAAHGDGAEIKPFVSSDDRVDGRAGRSYRVCRIKGVQHVSICDVVVRHREMPAVIERVSTRRTYRPDDGIHLRGEVGERDQPVQRGPVVLRCEPHQSVDRGRATEELEVVTRHHPAL